MSVPISPSAYIRLRVHAFNQIDFSVFPNGRQCEQRGQRRTRIVIMSLLHELSDVDKGQFCVLEIPFTEFTRYRLSF